MAEALLELQNREGRCLKLFQQLQNKEERCLKLFQGQIELMNKTADFLDKLYPNWKDNKDDYYKFIDEQEDGDPETLNDWSFGFPVEIKFEDLTHDQTIYLVLNDD